MHTGIEYRTISCLGDPDDLDLHVVRIDPRRWTLDAAVVNGASAREIARNHDAPFAINASFFDALRKPLGVIVRSGEEVQRAKTTSWQSIFFVSESGRPRIVLPSQWKEHRGDAWMAVQAGPRLVANGEKLTLKPTYSAPRAGVCIQWDRDLLFFAMPPERKLHTTEIARVASRKEADGGLACRDAMLFDGGHSVNFHVEDGVSIRGDLVPVFVYATPRAERRRPGG